MLLHMVGLAYYLHRYAYVGKVVWSFDIVSYLDAVTCIMCHDGAAAAAGCCVG